MNSIKKFMIFGLLLILCAGCRDINKPTNANISNSGKSQKNETLKSNEVLTPEEALNIAKKSFGEDMDYEYLTKVKINEVEYHQFRWGSKDGEADSRVCIDLITGKAYLQYVDGKFIDQKTYLEHMK